MTALSANATRRSMGLAGPLLSLLFAMPVAASAHIYQSSMVALNPAGNLVPASADASLRVVGVSEVEANNSAGAAGDLSVVPKRGPWYFTNSGTTDAITDGDLGRRCYVVDDNTVARTSAAGVRPVAGRVVGVDAFGVLVEVGIGDAEVGGEDLMFIVASSSLAARQFHHVNLDSSGLVILATAGGRAIGILQNAPANGAVAIVRPLQSGRVSRLIAGAAITLGDDVCVTTNGRAKTATATSVSSTTVVGARLTGIALVAAAADADEIRVLLVSSGTAPTTAS